MAEDYEWVYIALPENAFRDPQTGRGASEDALSDLIVQTLKELFVKAAVRLVASGPLRFRWINSAGATVFSGVSPGGEVQSQADFDALVEAMLTAIDDVRETISVIYEDSAGHSVRFCLRFT